MLNSQNVSRWFGRPAMTALLAVFATACAHAASAGETVMDSCPGNCSACRRTPSEVEIRADQPHRSWRYAEPRGYRAAVVRIVCQDDARTRSIGSGVLVKWAGKVVALTARHVVKDARRTIVELHNKRIHWAKVIGVDATWDCAVLELVGRPEGVEPATVEVGHDAMLRQGDRLESCGYGPDGRLAVNTGLFLGYRRSMASAQGPDDWMVISGHARAGDSGGPVFNARGRLVGILWGTNGAEVVCVQAGRIHVLLRKTGDTSKGNENRTIEGIDYGPESVKHTAGWCAYLQRAGCCPGDACTAAQRPMVPVVLPSQRRPTPAMPGPEPYQAPKVKVEVKAAGKPPYVLPYRNEEDAHNKATDERLERISSLLLEMQRMNQPAIAQRQPSVVGESAPEKKEASPLVAGLCVLGAIAAGAVVYFAATAKVES